ncbi:hypothetical protein BCR44DRAFT_1434444 [Catenaria anguillulae PL171]|uniref:Uncharacterized protein n=1 Tax=Catenaria anguillulae PL171 TaxID=765915 RepID=A0A1Y2HGU7_9FUNG|nr:hypothetical protein BCR44DRAFT_1438564 [Catenaria anguillulae PL171]ORZ35543.1 hypothetical protein BCR44DRAFT_1434444 [Catenaria anguillulae PL171]
MSIKIRRRRLDARAVVVVCRTAAMQLGSRLCRSVGGTEMQKVVRTRAVAVGGDGDVDAACKGKVEQKASQGMVGCRGKPCL